MALRKGAVEIGAALAGALALRTNDFDGSHASKNESSPVGHSSQRPKKKSRITPAPTTADTIASTSQRRSSFVAELGDPVLLHAEVVPELVQDGDANLTLEQRGVVAELVLERQPVDRDPVGQARRP